MKALMYDGLELGIFERDNEGVLRFHKHENIPATWLPYMFDINKDKNMEIVIKAWIKERIFPKDRIGSIFLVRKLGLKKYDADKIAEITRCSILTDPYWLAYTDEDTYTNNSARGKMGGTEYPYNSLDIRNEEDYIWRI